MINIVVDFHKVSIRNIKSSFLYLFNKDLIESFAYLDILEKDTLSLLNFEYFGWDQKKIFLSLNASSR
jgi:hypothetical protein